MDSSFEPPDQEFVAYAYPIYPVRVICPVYL
jgi:hypothetical protein